MAMIEFLIKYKYVLLFYLIIILIVYLNRKKFEIQAKVIALYRTKFGIKFINYAGTKFSKPLKILGYIGIPVGFLGMGFILYVFGEGIFKALSQPNAAPVVSPVLPGLPIPGTEVVVPLFYGLVAIFIVIIIHESSHGIIAKAHKIPVKNTGFVLFGPIPGAFVEPDEKIIEKSPKKVQLSIFAAGPFSNILTAALVILLFIFVISPVFGKVTEPQGFYFITVKEGGPANLSGIPANVVFDKVDDNVINTSTTFIEYMGAIKPGEEITISNENQEYKVKTGENPTNNTKPYLGIELMTKYKNEDKFAFKGLIFGMELLKWIWILSLGLGLANLLPLGPVDGGRMFHVATVGFFGKEKGQKIWIRVSIVVLFILIFLLLHPLIKAIFP